MGLGSLGEYGVVHGFIAPVFISFKRIGWTVYWPFSMELGVVATILLDVNVKRDTWSKDVHGTTSLVSLFLSFIKNWRPISFLC